MSLFSTSPERMAGDRKADEVALGSRCSSSDQTLKEINI